MNSNEKINSAFSVENPVSIEIDQRLNELSTILNERLKNILKDAESKSSEDKKIAAERLQEEFVAFVEGLEKKYTEVDLNKSSLYRLINQITIDAGCTSLDTKDGEIEKYIRELK